MHWTIDEDREDQHYSQVGLDLSFWDLTLFHFIEDTAIHEMDYKSYTQIFLKFIAKNKITVSIVGRNMIRCKKIQECNSVLESQLQWMSLLL